MSRLLPFLSLLAAAITLIGARPAVAQQHLDPSDVVVPDGLTIEVFARNLTYASDIAFGPNGEVYVSEAGGHTYGTKPEEAPPPRILQVMPDGTTQVVYDTVVPLDVIRETEVGEPIPEEGLISPVTGITWHDGLLYIAHRSRYSTLDPETGEFETIIDGIPSWGEFQNNKPIFHDGKMYFVNSTQGNSGTVDGHWIKVIDIFDKPQAHENPCEAVEVTGLDFFLDNTLTEEQGDSVRAEVYVPLGVDTEPGETIDGELWCHGAVYRADPDGTDIEVVAWGLRSNYGYGFSPAGRLITTQNSGNIMEPRPIYDDWEPVYEITEGKWYGWPDYYSGVPVTDERFTRPNDPEFTGNPFPHAFSLTEETRMRLLGGAELPPQPLVRLPIHSAAEGMVFGRSAWGLDPEEEILVAEFGAIIPYYKDPGGWPGFRVQKVDLLTGEVTDFLVNESEKPAWATEGGGLRRPLQVAWGPDSSLYLVDFGVIKFSPEGMDAMPNTAVIWKVSATTGTAVEEGADVPRTFELAQNYPNPFNPETTIRYALNEPGNVKLEIYDVQGRLVRELVSGVQPAGSHEVVWDARDRNGRSVPSGTYFYQLQYGETGLEVRTMTLIR